MSITSLPLARPAATPSSANSTLPTSGVSGTMMMMMSEACATSRPLAQTLAPAPATSSGTLPCVWTASLCPPFMRWPAMGVPMMPRPMKPMFRDAVLIACLPCVECGFAIYLMSCWRQPSPAWVAAAGLYSQPIQPV